jgi:hypothetical protein
MKVHGGAAMKMADRFMRRTVLVFLFAVLSLPSVWPQSKAQPWIGEWGIYVEEMAGALGRRGSLVLTADSVERGEYYGEQRDTYIAYKGTLNASGSKMSWTYLYSREDPFGQWETMNDPKLVKDITWKVEGDRLTLALPTKSGAADIQRYYRNDAAAREVLTAGTVQAAPAPDAVSGPWIGSWLCDLPAGGPVARVGLNMVGSVIQVALFAPTGAFQGNMGTFTVSGATMTWTYTHQSVVWGGAWSPLASVIVSEPIAWKVSGDTMTLDFKPKDAAPYTLVFKRLAQ